MSLWETICAEHASVEPKPVEQPRKLIDNNEELDVKTCSAGAYYDRVLMPIISAGLTAMVKEAEVENVFKYKKRNKFNGCDFLTEFLFNANPKRKNQCEKTQLSDIPFCQAFDQDFPRRQLPLSLRLTEDQAATMIQSWYRGVKTRRRPEINELIKYQAALR